MTAYKRFIAGAVCPHCHSIDTIMLLLEPEEHISCVHCGWLQRKADLTTEQPAPANSQVMHFVKRSRSK